MKKDGYLYSEMKRARLKFLVAVAVAVALFAGFAAAKAPYIKTKHTGPSKLNVALFEKDTETVAIDELIELGRKETKTLASACYDENSYWQGDKYHYSLELRDIEDTGASFTQKITQGPDTGKVVDVCKIYTAHLGDRSIAVLAAPQWEPVTKVDGHLTELSRPVMAKLSEKLGEGEQLELCEYMLDIRNTEMETENTDVIIFWLLLALSLYFVAKLAFYFAKPEMTPTYRQLAKYGDVLTVAQEVDRQAELESAYFDAKTFVMQDYIAHRSTFKLVVERNHMARH